MMIERIGENKRAKLSEDETMAEEFQQIKKTTNHSAPA